MASLMARRAWRSSISLARFAAIFEKGKTMDARIIIIERVINSSNSVSPLMRGELILFLQKLMKPSLIGL
jgi:hypothetical protein